MPRTLRIALAGSPNSGKSALFNALTGHRQKVANYAGVTVERHSGQYFMVCGRPIDIIDLPGAYSLDATSLDQKVTRDFLLGEIKGEERPDAVLCVVDATKLRDNLRFVLELKRTGYPLVLALNMMDLAERDGIAIDADSLSAELGIPVIPTVAVRRKGLQPLLCFLNHDFCDMVGGETKAPDAAALPQGDELRALQQDAKKIAKAAILGEGRMHKVTRVLDEIVLNPVAGPFILLGVLFLMFQAVFSWAAWPMDMIDSGVLSLQDFVGTVVPEGFMRSLLLDGVLAGVGSVIIFLPQIIILFFFIHLLEQSGYMTRAAFLMDRLMSRVGLSGHTFIPLLSSFACAIPGIMAARTIDDPRDRLTTIMIAPLMTCSARLPVYTLIIAAFIPPVTVWGGANLQGLVMFALYLIGIVAALIAAAVFNVTGAKRGPRWFMMELPRYRLPVWRDLALGLWARVLIFLKRAGTIILATTVLLWGLASYPNPPEGAEGPDVVYSFAGMLGRGLEVIFAPIGFTWDICIALIPGMAAREVAVAALGTIYSLSGNEEAITESLATTLQTAWSLPTALAFLAWFIFAPQCFATMAVTRRETNSWKWTGFMAGYLFALAYVAAGLTYWIARAILL